MDFALNELEAVGVTDTPGVSVGSTRSPPPGGVLLLDENGGFEGRLGFGHGKPDRLIVR